MPIWSIFRAPEKVEIRSEEKFLRQLLCDYPRWIRGHLSLGELLLSQAKDLSSRDLETAHLSARAVLALLGEANFRGSFFARSRSRALWRARYLIAVVTELEGRQGEALALYQNLIDDEVVRGNPPPQLIERVSGCALILGEREQALNLLRRAPPSLLSKEANDLRELLLLSEKSNPAQ